MPTPPRLAYRFNERKAAQVAARFLALAGGRLPYLSAIKLIYLADRESLRVTGFPMTGDSFASLPHGPVSRAVCDLFRGERSSNGEWGGLVKTEGYDGVLVGEPAADELSRFEKETIDALWQRFKGMNQWRLRDFTHGLPEYQDPHGSSIPIYPGQVLLQSGWTLQRIRDLAEEASAVTALSSAD
jgi:uncharacterized phage-associated protein